MAALREMPFTRMTLDEFLRWDPGTPHLRRWNLVDGEPVAMAPATQSHAAIQGELCALIRNHLLDSQSSCRVLPEAGIVPQLRANMNFRVPDLAVTCSPERGGQMTPDPVLIVEVLSPGNEKVTRANVWAYASIPSVTEIVLLHSSRIAAEVMRRQTDGAWLAEATLLGPTDRLQLTSIGAVFPLADAYRTSDVTPPR